MRIATLPQRREKGLAHRMSMNAQVKGLGVHGWRYLPLTRTRCKLLTCDVATLRLSPAWCVAPRPSAKRPWCLRHRLDECDTVDLITACCDGATVAAHGLSVKRQRIWHIAGVTSPHLTYSTSDECNADHDAQRSVATRRLPRA